jgi:hypothetical protein
MNVRALRDGATLDRPVDVIDFARHIERIEPEHLDAVGEVWLRYSAKATILSVLAELRRERRALEKATRALERLANMRPNKRARRGPVKAIRG